MKSLTLNAPSLPFDLAVVAGGAQRSTTLPVSLAAMSAVAEDAGRAARDGHSLAVTPATLSPTIFLLLAEGTRDGRRAAAILSDLFRDCMRGALDPATD